MVEPARNKVHKVIAAIILHGFDTENPESDVQDETIVAVQLNRDGFVRESSFIAGDLRLENKNAVSILMERFLNDPAVIGGELEPAPAVSPPVEGSTTQDSGGDSARQEQEARADPDPEAPATIIPSIKLSELVHATVAGSKRMGCTAEIRRCEDGAKMPTLPGGLYVDSEDATGGKTMRLKVKLGVMWVNGEEIVPGRKMKVVGGIAVNAVNTAALRYVRVRRITTVFICQLKSTQYIGEISKATRARPLGRQWQSDHSERMLHCPNIWRTSRATCT